MSSETELRGPTLAEFKQYQALMSATITGLLEKIMRFQRAESESEASELSRPKKATSGKARGDVEGGYVYILSNPAMPGLLKICKTTGDPRSEVLALLGEGIPGSFRIEFAMFCENPDWLESEVHEDFEHCRHGGQNFFRAGLDDAIYSLIETQYDWLTAGDRDGMIHRTEIENYANATKVHPLEIPNLVRRMEDSDWEILKARWKKFQIEDRRDA